MDIRYERPMTGNVLQAQKFTAGEALAVGVIVDMSGGKVEAAADATVAAVGYTVSTASGDGADVQVMPFIGGHVYSVPVIASVVPGDNLEWDATSGNFVESATAPMAKCFPNGQESGVADERTMFVVNSALYI